jgi:parvulin-like peptidyl-prolyl isomerase
VNKAFFLIAIFLFVALGWLACKEEQDIATVGGKSITAEQFGAYLRFKRLQTDDAAKRDKLLGTFLEREALTQAIEKENFLDPADVQAEFDEFRRNLYINRYFQKFLQEKVTEQAMNNFYSSHAADYQDKMIKVAHILLRTHRKMAPVERQAKLTQARDAHSRLKKGEDFAETAEAFSEDKASAKKGGDLGWIKQGSVDPRFSEKVFSMKTGQVSEPFETAFGYHIVKILEEPKTIKRSFQAVQGDIRYKLHAQAKKAEIERLTGKVSVLKSPCRVPFDLQMRSYRPVPPGS